jgi:hypothetical protein
VRLVGFLCEARDFESRSRERGRRDRERDVRTGDSGGRDSVNRAGSGWITGRSRAWNSRSAGRGFLRVRVGCAWGWLLSYRGWSDGSVDVDRLGAKKLDPV